MHGRRDKGWGRCGLIALALLSACVWAGCGSSGSVSEAPGAGTEPESSMALAGAEATDRPNLPAPEIVATLERRIAAMNVGDGAAAAACYTEDAVLGETDLTPHLISRGRAELAARFDDLYSMGLRLAPAGAPIANDRYVAEPTRFYNGNEPGRGAGMLVFEIGAANKLAHQWMIGWAAGPEKTWSILRSPSAYEPNLPPRRVMKVLKGHMAAIDRGDGRAAASYYARSGKLEDLSRSVGRLSRGRTAVAARLEELSSHGLRLAPAGSPITYDVYVAQPVRFSRADGPGSGAGMLVLQFDPAFEIVHAWIIGWMSDTPDQSVTSAPITSTSSAVTHRGEGEIAFTRDTMIGPDDLIEQQGIYLVNADGSGLRRLVDETDARNPAWSPDGTRLAYFDSSGVNVIHADGSERRFVARAKAWGGWAGWLAWSPDGTRIAFTSSTGDRRDLYVVDADGSGRRRLTNGRPGRSVEHLAWAPDGRIFFGTRAPDAGESRICSVNGDGSDLVVLRDLMGGGSFSLSADGKWLLVWEANCLVRLPAHDPRPGRETLILSGITQRIRPKSQCFFALASAWAPDGDRIAFAADQQAWICPTPIWIVDADGHHLRKVPRAGVGWDPVWRPE